MWTTFAAAVGGSAAGLTGLTFIVVAFRFDVVAVSQEYRNRAAQTLSLFVTVVTAALLVTIPQPTWALGLELLAAGAASAVLLLTLDRAARRGAPSHRTRPIHTVVLSLFAAGIVVAGLLTLAGRDGLGFFAASAQLGVVWGAYGAWIFLTQAGMTPAEPAEPALAR